MDLGTVVGIVLAFGLVITAMALGVGVGPYLDIQSFLIVVGGSIASLLIAFKMEEMKQFITVFMIAIKPPQSNVPELIEKLVSYATDARRDGILALETKVNNEEDAFLKKGLSLAVDGNEPDIIRDLLEIETGQMDNRHKQRANMFDQFGGIAGAFGMIGTLVGLVAMLVNMNDPSLIGNILGAPIANILNVRNADEVLVKTIVIEGIMSIQAGDNPRTLEQKLLSFLPPKERNSQFE